MIRRAAAAVIAAAALVSGLVFGVTAPAQASEVSPTGTQSFAQIAACAASADQVLASIVVDASGSLADTDPSNARVRAINVALDALGGLQTSSNGRLRVDADLSTFSNGYTQRVGWGPVTGSHGSQLRSVAESTLPGATNGGTDYRKALRGAQRSLDGEAKSVGGKSCKVMLWFTDGGLDVGAGTAGAAAQICDRQGIADSVRRDGIAVVALALFTGGTNDGVTQSDRDRLKAIAETSGGGKTCGSSPLPSGAAGGAYLRAADAGALTRLFAQAAAMIGGATPQGSVVCPSAACVSGELRIPLDKAAAGFRLVLSNPSNSPVALTSPAGQRASLRSSSSSQASDGTKVSVTVQDALTTVDVRRGSGSRTNSVWVLRNTGTQPVQIDRYYFWGASIGIAAKQKIVVGQPGAITITVRDSDGAPLDEKSLSSTTVAATVNGRAVTVSPRASGVWSATVTVPTGDVAPSLHVIVSAQAVTAAHGLRLGPLTTDTDIATSLPLSFPTVTPGRLTLPQEIGVEPTSGQLHVRGSADGPTKVCFLPASVEGSRGSGHVTVTPSDQCVQLAKGESKSVQVRGSLAHAADGRVDGTLPVRLTGAHGNTATVRIPISFTTARPVDEPVRWLLVAIFVFVAIALAWISAEVARRLSDRYRLGTDTAVASVPVEFDASGVRRADMPGAAPLFDAERDFESMRRPKLSRPAGFETRGIRFGRSFPLWPTRPGRAVVSSLSDQIVIAPRGPRDLAVDKAGSRAEIGFPGTTGAVLLVDPRAVSDETQAVRGQLVMLVDERDGVSSVLPDRVDELAGAGWDRILDRVRAAATFRADKAAPTPTTKPSPEPQPPASAERETPEPAAVGVSKLMDWDDDSAPTPRPAESPRRRSPEPRRTRAAAPPPPPPPPSPADADPFEAPPSSSSVNFLD